MVLNRQKTLVARFAPEIDVKSNSVRQSMVDRLMDQIQRAASFHQLELSLRRSHARLFVCYDDERVIDLLQSIFGLGSLALIDVESPIDIQAMEAAIQTFTPHLAGKSFCVRLKHSGQLRALGWTSPQIEARLGAKLIAGAKGVDLKQPDLKIDVELDLGSAYFSIRRLPGASGFPLASQGRALTMLSGGFDSAVAAWLMMRRGVSLDYFTSPLLMAPVTPRLLGCRGSAPATSHDIAFFSGLARIAKSN